MKYSELLAKKRLGTTRRHKNGMNMTIVRYNTSVDIDIEFEDGTVLEHKRYNYFCANAVDSRGYKIGDRGNKLGKTSKQYNKNKYLTGDKQQSSRERIRSEKIGATIKCKNGLMATVINYNNDKDLDVQFEDGVVVHVKYYSQFKRGYIRHPNLRVGSARKVWESNSSVKHKYTDMNMYIIERYKNNKVDVRFEDGIIVKNVDLSNFRKGIVAHPNYSPKRDRTDEIVSTKGGLEVKIYNWRKYSNYRLEFIHEGVKHFTCTCKVCKCEHLLRLSEMKDFECSCKQ